VAVIDRLAAGLEGKYRIERELGAGGMAVVYLARDARHDRLVALKLLRPELSAILGAERFLAEIRTTANLQHPHILPLHDSGEVDGLVYYVMPFVDGESLRDRLNREKQLPVDDAVRIAREVASALDYAHRRGVVHRDIKPENILLHDGQAMVADFGIALAAARSDRDTRLTETGMSLGTPQYMAPEQAMGDRDVGPKADVYASGCVLYEMLVGEPPFAGPTPQSIVARMLTEQPRGLQVQRQTVPPHVEAATLKALQRLPADRFASASQFADALGDVGFTAPGLKTIEVTATRSRRDWPWIVPVAAAAVLTAVITSLAWLALQPEPPPPAVVRFSVPVLAAQGLPNVSRSVLAVSPDGQELVFAAPSQLLRRSLSSHVLEPIAGTQSQSGGVSNPVFSPDGQFIAFWSMGTIKRVPTVGGLPFTITQSVQALGMDWGEGGIIFATDNDIFRVSPDGGQPELVVDLPPNHTPLGPQLLPGGMLVLFTMAEGSGADRWTRAQIFVADLRTKERTRLIDGGADGRYVPSGHLVFGRGGTLHAVAFDLGSLKVSGTPAPVIEGIRSGLFSATGTVHFAFSRNGVLVYVPGPPGDVVTSLDIGMTGRDGNTEFLGLPPARYEYPRVSRDGGRLAVGTDNGREAIIWVYDLNRSSALRRLTLGGRERYPIWSGDGQWVAYQSTRDGASGILRRRADGTGSEEQLTTADTGTIHIPESWSPTEDVMLYSKTRNDTTTLWLYSVATKTSTSFGNVRSLANLIGSVFSPDGKWVAYASSTERSTTTENYVHIQPFPATGATYQISQSGENGHHPLWSRDQKELYYVPLVGQFVARSITTQPTISFGNPVPVPRGFPVAPPVTPRTFDVTGDGRIISVVARRTADSTGGSAVSGTMLAPSEVMVVLNWFEELKAKVRPN
jgi:serine/threonine-protein kinase